MTHELQAQLTALETANLLRQVQPGADAEYWFKHTMIQDAIYGSLLKSARADLHRRVAEAAEELTPADSEDRAPTLALHYERAGMARPALRYLLEAGDQALRRYAHREALGFYDRALALLDQDDTLSSTQVLLVYTGRGEALKALGDHPAARDNYEAMLGFARKTGGPAEQADALILLVTVELLISGLAEGKVERLNEAVELARASGSPLLEARALWNMGLAYRFEDPPRSVPYFESAAEIARAHSEDPKMREILAYVLTDFSVANFMRGKYRDSGRYSTEAASIFRELDNRAMLADSLGGLSQFYYMSGDPEAARRTSTEALELNRSIENHWGIAYSAWGLITTSIDVGAFEAALAIGQEALTHARQISFPILVGLNGLEVARCLGELGRVDEAVAQAEESKRALDRIPAPQWAAMSRGVVAAANLLRGDPAQAWEALDGIAWKAEEQPNHMRGIMLIGNIVAEVGVRSGHYAEMERFCGWMLPYLETEGLQRLAGELLYWCGRRLAAQGDHANALVTLEQSRATLARIGVPVLLWRVDAALAASLAANGDHAGAAAARERSVATIERLAAGIKDPELRASFLARGEVQEVLQALV